MKKVVFLTMIMSLIFLRCTQETRSPLEGAWQLVSGTWVSIEETYPGQITGSDIKMWTKDYFAFAGEFQFDTVVLDNYGWGKYKFIEGNKYEEYIIHHHNAPGSKGQTIKMLMELRNDTLIQRWPVDENWNLAEDHSTEKYIQLK